jgi:ferredoxin
MNVSLKTLFRQETRRGLVRSVGCVRPDPSRCVQCGICSYNCPSGIDIRGYSWEGLPVQDSRCLTCGECILRCPRGALRFDHLPIFVLNEGA